MHPAYYDFVALARHCSASFFAALIDIPVLYEKAFDGWPAMRTKNCLRLASCETSDFDDVDVVVDEAGFLITLSLLVFPFAFAFPFAFGFGLHTFIIRLCIAFVISATALAAEGGSVDPAAES